METFLRNTSFYVEHTLLYKDTMLPVNLDSLNDIIIEYYHYSTGTNLLTRKFSTGGVNKVNSAGGVCAVYINDADTLGSNKGMYMFRVTAKVANTNFDGGEAEFANFGKAFILT